ncbi:MAG: mechanosensitive ion channel family protein [Cyanobacteria bacterium P01_A01_bin.116]
MNSLIQEVQTTLVELAGESVKVIPGLLLAVVVLFITRTAANLVRRAIRKLAFSTLKSLSLQSLLIQTSYAATWTAGILFACTLAFQDVGFNDLIALLGFGSVAIGFAFQDIFKNFLAGILLLLQEPFSLGDQIIVSGFEGTVEDIALRSTQLRTYQGELIVMPNSVVFTSPVQVMTGQPSRRTDLAIGVDYNTPLPHAVETLLSAAESVEDVGTQPAVEVDIVGFGDSSIDLIVRYWTKSQQADVRRVKTQMMIALKQACDRADIGIPYPIRTVYHFDQEKYNDHTRLPATSTTANSKKENSQDEAAAKSNYML